MQNFNVLKKIGVKNTYINQKIKSVFDIPFNTIEHNETHTLSYDDLNHWNIGIIFGNSGSGKTQLGLKIAEKEKIKIIEKFEWNNDSVISNFNHSDFNFILEVLRNVGLNTQISLLKPYCVLSNGEKMRLDLAKAIIENDFIIIDEFTSVVNREIAALICKCISKVIKKYNKKVIFISCHKDFFSDLLPDWLYDIDNKIFKKDCLWQRKTRQFHIRTGTIAEWQLFKKFHYLTANAQNSKHIFILENEHKKAIGICIFQIFPSRKKIFKVKRLVICPDYQGLGLGQIFLENCCQIMQSKFNDHKITITTSLKFFAMSLRKNKNFKDMTQNSNLQTIKALNKSRKINFQSFFYAKYRNIANF